MHVNSHHYLSAVLVLIKALLDLDLFRESLKQDSAPLVSYSGGEKLIRGSPDIGIKKRGSYCVCGVLEYGSQTRVTPGSPILGIMQEPYVVTHWSCYLFSSRYVM